jgi:hypothetical protein
VILRRGREPGENEDAGQQGQDRVSKGNPEMPECCHRMEYAAFNGQKYENIFERAKHRTVTGR